MEALSPYGYRKPRAWRHAILVILMTKRSLSKRASFRRVNGSPRRLTYAVSIGSNGYYCGDRNDAASLLHFSQAASIQRYCQSRSIARFTDAPTRRVRDVFVRGSDAHYAGT